MVSKSIVGLMGVVVFIGGLLMLGYGMRTSNFSPAPPGNDNFVYAVLAIPIILFGFGMFAWTVMTFKFPK
jgi:membrane-bound ClpP family serine protease